MQSVIKRQWMMILNVNVRHSCSGSRNKTKPSITQSTERQQPHKTHRPIIHYQMYSCRIYQQGLYS